MFLFEKFSVRQRNALLIFDLKFFVYIVELFQFLFDFDMTLKLHCMLIFFFYTH